MNLCRPDARKSCAACCGLYNVPDATRPALHATLERRTHAFRGVERSPQAIADYQEWVSASEPGAPLDEAIHVCEFSGFLDPLQRVVGCQLHPTAPGNGGVDLRGLCHYGSMACKSFYCPAWEQIPVQHQELVCALIDDWHAYGLVMTDVDFVRSLFGLLEDRIAAELNPDRVRSGRAAKILAQMLSWKDSWPLAGTSLLRRNRYYFKATAPSAGPQASMECLLACLTHTFGVAHNVNRAQGFVREAMEEFATAYAEPASIV